MCFVEPQLVCHLFSASRPRHVCQTYVRADLMQPCTLCRPSHRSLSNDDRCFEHYLMDSFQSVCGSAGSPRQKVKCMMPITSPKYDVQNCFMTSSLTYFPLCPPLVRSPSKLHWWHRKTLSWQEVADRVRLRKQVLVADSTTWVSKTFRKRSTVTPKGYIAHLSS